MIGKYTEYDIKTTINADMSQIDIRVNGVTHYRLKQILRLTRQNFLMVPVFLSRQSFRTAKLTPVLQ